MGDQGAAPIVKVDSSQSFQPLFHVSQTLDQSRQLDLKPVYISLGLDPTSFRPDVGGTSDSVPASGATPRAFQTALRGSKQFSDRIWFFQGDSYIRYFEKENGHDTIEGPLKITQGWTNWPESFSTGVDASLHGTDAFEGKVWFFKGSQYLRYDLVRDQVELPPRPIAGNWRGVPDAFTAKIDAAIHGVGTYFGVVWLFRGNQYVRYNLKTDTAETGAQPIAGNWGGQSWPSTFANGFDFAFYGTGVNAEKIYFFRGEEYILYNLNTDTVEAGPRPITTNWGELARFIPRPQLFLREQYRVHLFRGEMGRGDMVPGPPPLRPGERIELYVVTKQSTTITTRSSDNLLESQDAHSGNLFSQSVKDDQSESGSKEDYAYGLDSSFQGEVSINPLGGGGSANAHLSVQGQTQDVRNNYAKAVGKQLDTQASDTHDIHKQQVRVTENASTIQTETETAYKEVVDNSNNTEPANVILFQLTQEYIVVLSLVDARIVFFNGDPRQMKSVSISEMQTLLEICLKQPDLQAKVAADVVDTLQHIADYAGQTRSLIVPLDQAPGKNAHRIDTTLTSSYDAKDSAGNPLRTVTVPGIILSVERPVTLTSNLAMASLKTNG